MDTKTELEVLILRDSLECTSLTADAFEALVNGGDNVRVCLCFFVRFQAV